MINVYDNHPDNTEGFFYGEIIARVNPNTKLDYWDGNNYTNNGTGLHKGITKLRKPHDPKRPYVIIITSQWEGDKDYGYCVDKSEAAREIVTAGHGRCGWVWPEIKDAIRILAEK
jgi:hypothetical protein